ncbi:MAG: RNA 2',3'-cyclic phosphodiesterase [Acidobacteriaceae bacterium]|nr:RNA 2',3'-cyclic phosphodiesterase [Acidobacteriaceae bacterium]
MRIFVGIPLPQVACESLKSVLHTFQSSQAGSAVRWSEPEGWHVTLAFPGQVHEEQLVVLRESLQRIACGPIPLTVEGVEVYARAGVLAAKIVPTEPLFLLQQRVAAAAEMCGFPIENRPFRPHVTLARSRFEGRLRALAEDFETIQARFVAGRFCLYESVRDSTGSRYVVKSEFLLQ